MAKRNGKESPVGASVAAEFTPLAVSIAQVAILGGVAEQVIRLLTGGAADPQGGSPHVAASSEQVSRWADPEKGPESSGPTLTPAEDAGELSRLMQKVRERRTTPRRRPKPASS